MSLQARRQAEQADNTPFISAAPSPNLQVPEFMLWTGIPTWHLWPAHLSSATTSPAVPVLVLGGANCCTNCFGASLHPLMRRSWSFGKREAQSTCCVPAFTFKIFPSGRGWVTTRTYWGDDHVTLPPRVSSSCNGRQHTTPLTFAL